MLFISLLTCPSVTLLIQGQTPSPRSQKGRSHQEAPPPPQVQEGRRSQAQTPPSPPRLIAVRMNAKSARVFARVCFKINL
jgi:hypothetical protein